MNIKIKFLAFVLVILISFSLGVFILQTIGNKNSQDLKIRVACIGDSITGGSEYPSDLWMLLGSNYTVGNFGVGGTTISVESDSSYMNQSAFENAKRFQPNIVIIMLGSNDAHPVDEQYNASFVNDYISLVDGFRGLASKPQIWIVKPPPIFNNGTGISTENFDTYIIPNIEKVANITNLPLIDVYTPLLNHSDYFSDGVHPNSEGSQAIANIMYTAISQASSTQH